MALLSIIRRWHLRDHLPIREIARRTGLSRNTIRKYLRAGTVEPRFKVPERSSRLDPYAERLSAWLRREMGRPRKQKRTLRQLHADLVALGYDGSYGRVAAFARAWRDDYRQAQQLSGRGTFVPLSFAPGEAFQFDWSCEYVFVGGIRRRLPTAVRRVGAMPGSGDSRELPLADNRTDPEAHTGERQFELQVLEKLLHSFGGHDCLGQGCNTARKASVIIQVEMLEPMG